MPPQSDAALHSLLDQLGAPPPPPPISPSARRDGPSALAPAPTFARADLPDALALANAQLAAAGSPARLPRLADSSAAAAHDALAAALGVVVSLARSCAAGARLRREAEERCEALGRERDAAVKAGERARKVVAAREAEVHAVEMRKAGGERKGAAVRRKLEGEVAELQGRLAAICRREAALKFEAKRRESEFAKLQAHVHAMLANRGAVKPPEVRLVAGGYAGAHLDDVYELAERYPRMVEASYEERHEALVAESEGMRHMLRAVQLELDDMVLAQAAARPEPATLSGGENSSEVSDDENDKVPAEAPTDEQMDLPFDYIKEDYESLLRQKFALLRAALENATPTK